MTDLKNQLRTYYEATTEPVDVTAIAIDPDDVVVGQIPQATRRRSNVTTQSTQGTRNWWQGPRVAVLASLALIAVVAAAVLVTNDSGSDVADDPSPRAVLLDFQDAYNAGDLGDVVALFAEDAVVTRYPGSRGEGVEDLEANIEEEFSAYGGKYEMTEIEVAGDTVTFRHSWSHGDFCGTAAGHRMVVSNGLIQAWDFPSTTGSC